MESIGHQRVYNRILAVMLHLKRYSYRSQARLMRDTGASEAALSRLLSGRSNPSYSLAISVVEALEAHLGKRVDPREILSVSGTFPTPSVCTLCGCPGCLPPQVYDTEDRIKPEYRHIEKGKWAFQYDPSRSTLTVVPLEEA